MFQELLARKKPPWLNKLSLGVSAVVLLLTVWSIKSYYDGRDVEQSFISPHTVRNHIYNIYRKTGIRNRFQLLALFQED